MTCGPCARTGPSVFVHGLNVLFDTPDEAKPVAEILWAVILGLALPGVVHAAVSKREDASSQCLTTPRRRR